MDDAVLIGGGGHAGVVAQLLRQANRNVIGYTAPVEGTLDLPYLGTDAALASLRGAVIAAFGVGKSDTSDRRAKIFLSVNESGLDFAALVAESALVHEDVTISKGTVVMDGAVVICGSRLGACCIINTNATVDHDCTIGDDVHISPGAVLCGGVTLESNVMIGAGATVLPGLSIASGTLVGAGATVVDSIDYPGVYVGCPAQYRR